MFRKVFRLGLGLLTDRLHPSSNKLRHLSTQLPHNLNLHSVKKKFLLLLFPFLESFSKTKMNQQAVSHQPFAFHFMVFVRTREREWESGGITGQDRRKKGRWPSRVRATQNPQEQLLHFLCKTEKKTGTNTHTHTKCWIQMLWVANLRT